MPMSPLITPAALHSRRHEPDTLIFDCRFDLADPEAGRRLWLEGHIPGAFYADLNRHLSDLTRVGHGRHPLPDPAALSEFFRLHGCTPETTVIAYDARDGMFAARLWWLLKWLGHARVQVLDGGLEAWIASGGAVSSAVPMTPVPAGPWPNDRASLVAEIDVDTVQLQLANGTLKLIDARAAPRFRGDVEPIDRVAGHVPGALNRPFTDNLLANGAFKSPEQLRAEWAPLEPLAEQHLAVMCGSGVTACHHVLARAVAGLAPARLYADSWSGWISDPSRPISRAL
jgi:thiosulfate/3-mercaptopyruvate sulfurtransferase